MHLVARSRRRRGATIVESAVVYTAMLLLLFGVFSGGLGIFRYQEMAWLSQDAARYASVRGQYYSKETGKPSPTKADLANDVVLKQAVAMDPALLTVEVWLVDGITGAVTDWDLSDKAPTATTTDGQRVANRVRVTVTFRWMPEVVLVGPIHLSCTTETPMSF